MVQVIKDGNGVNSGVYIPMSDWNELVRKHDDLKALVNIEQDDRKKVKLSDLIGKLSDKTAADMLKYVEASRNEWEDHQ